MSKRAMICVIPLLLISAPMLRAQEKKEKTEKARELPTAIVRMQSIEQLLENVKYVAALADQEEPVKQLDGLIQSMVGDQGLDGFDLKRPVALYGYLGEFVVDSTAVAMLPVADEKAVLAVLGQLELKPEKGEDGIYTIKKKDKLKDDVFFRFAHKYVYVTTRGPAALALGKLVAPERIFTGDKAGVFSAQFDLDAIPAGVRQAALVELELKIADEKEKQRPGESKPEHLVKIQVLDQLFTNVSSVIKDGKTLIVNFDVDRKNGSLALDLSMAPRENSKLAGDIQELGKVKSAAAAVLSRGAAVKGAMHFVLPEDVSQALAGAVENEMKKNIAKQEDPKARELGEKLMKSILPTVEAGLVDFAFDLRGPGMQGTYTLLAAAAVKQGKDMDKALREAVQSLPEEARQGIKLDCARAGDTPIHSIEGIKDENTRKHLGEGPVYIAIRDDAVFLATGDGDEVLAALKAAVTTPPQPGIPFQFEMSLGRLALLMEKHKPEAAKVLKEVFGKNPKGDRVRVSVEGGKALKVQMRIEAEIIRFAARLAEARKQGDSDR